MRYLILLALLGFAPPAFAQTAIVPATIHGCGTVTATAASAAITAAVTLCPNSPPLPGGGSSTIALKVKVQGNATAGVYVCKFGGACTTSGELLLAGESGTFGINRDINAGPPTVLAVSGSQPVYLEW
jgi:hypothetical protein